MPRLLNSISACQHFSTSALQQLGWQAGKLTPTAAVGADRLTG
jgi:hypothetical protein